MYARWITILENFDFESQYIAGYKHRNADGLSRIPDRKCKNANCMECVPKQSVGLINPQDVDIENPQLHHIDTKEIELQSSEIRDKEMSNWSDAWENEEMSEV
jgi:hypothetical protein